MNALSASDFDTYWQTYYRDRPFFAERARFMRYAHGPAAKIVVTSRHEPTATRFAAIEARPHGSLKGKPPHLLVATRGENAVKSSVAGSP